MSRRLSAALIPTALLASLAIAGPSAADPVQPRIVGGGNADISKYPWQAAVTVSRDDYPGFNPFQRQFCGGSLITARIVITASHCVEGGDQDCPEPPLPCTPIHDPAPGDGTERMDGDDMGVVLGSTVLSTAPPGNEHDVIDVEMHPDYDPNSLDNDVAFLVLAGPASQQTIDIAGGNEDALWDPGSPTEVSGWGATSEGGPGSDHLKAAVTPIISDSDCLASSYGDEFHPATMVCAGYLEGGTDTCQGDSGGPLQAPAQGDVYRLVGITSWGYGCAGPDAPGIYSRIAAPALRSSIVSQVAGLEAEHGLPHEEIVGSGAQPRQSDPAPPPPPGGGQAPGPHTDPGPSAARTKCLKQNKRRAKRGKRKRKCPRR